MPEFIFEVVSEYRAPEIFLRILYQPQCDRFLENIYLIFAKYSACLFKNHSVVLLFKFAVVAMKRNYWLKHVDFINLVIVFIEITIVYCFLNSHVEFG